jgi:hypothetical protein
MEIKLSPNKSHVGVYFYGVSVELKQKIALNNSAGDFISDTIWKKGQTCVLRPIELRKMNKVISDVLNRRVLDSRREPRN